MAWDWRMHENTNGAELFLVYNLNVRYVVNVFLQLVGRVVLSLV